MLVRRAWIGRGGGAALAAGSFAGIAGFRPRGTAPMVSARAPVASVAAMEKVHQRTSRQQQERQGAHQVGTVLGEKEEASHREEAEEDPGHRGTPLGAKAGCRI